MRTLEFNANIFFSIPNSILEHKDGIIEVLGEKYEIGILESEGNIDSESHILDEIPFIIARSKGKHSKIEISNKKAKISVGFDDDFMFDFPKCVEYLKERVNLVFEAIGTIKGIRIMFSGVYCTFIFEKITNPIEILKSPLEKKLNDVFESEEVYDASSKLTYVIEDKYYINIQLGNIRGNQQVENNPEITQKIHCLAVTLDVNDRYGFNETDNYESFKGDMDRNIELLEEFVSEKIQSIIY